MADNMQKLGLDATELIASLTNATNVFKAHNNAIDDVVISYVDYNKKGEAVKATGKMILESGQAVDVMLRKQKGAWDAQVTGIDNYTKAMRDAAAATKMQAGAGDAQNFMKMAGIPNAAGLKAALMDSFRTVQQDLAKAIGGTEGGSKIADEIFGKMKNGVIEVESDIRRRLIQGALADVLRLSERIAAAQSAATKTTPVAPVGPSSMTAGELGSIRSQVTTIFPIDKNAALSSIASYQAAVNSLLSSVARGKLTMQEFNSLFTSVKQNPTGDFAGQNQQLAMVQQSIQKVIIGYNAMKNSANQAGQAGSQAGRSLFVSFEQFVKLLEVQVIHRIFGNLITTMQQSIGKAAELKVKIAEVLTISQGSGLNNEGMSAFIRQRSDEFNRPQTDITEGLYQAFSNQIIKSAADLQTFDQALRLSRITVSSVADSVNLLSSVMRSYNLSNVQAEGVVNSLFKAVELGRFRVSELADTFGRISVIGSQLGVGHNELLAIMAQLTITGLKASEAETQISAMMNAFMRPSEGMKQVLRSWGFESGEAALRTMTLTNAIARLYQEAQSGRVNLSELIPNIRAMRGIVGARDSGAIARTQSEIENAAPSANRADSLVRENEGTKFQQEIEKIRNLFLDAGSTIAKEIQAMAAPWGGLSEVVKSTSSAMGEFAKAGLTGLGILNSLLGIIKPLGGDLGTLVKVYIDYKITVMAVNTVTSAAIAINSVWAALQMELTSVTGLSTRATVLDRLARLTSAAATTTQSAALAQYSAFTASSTALTEVAAASQTRLAIATRLSAAAWALTPYALIGVGIAVLTGQADALYNRLLRLTEVAERFGEAAKVATETQKEFDKDLNSRISERERNFTNTLTSVGRRAGEVFADLTSQSNRLIDAQKAVVANTTENMRVAFRGISDEMRKVMSDIDRKITEARSGIKESLRKSLAFGDRDQSDAFRRQLDALGRKPEIVNPIDMSGQEGMMRYMQEAAKFRIEEQQFNVQKQLIQQRINVLLQQGNELAANGDEESMQSARRKFEEIRRLTEQSFQLQTEHNRRGAEFSALGGVPGLPGAIINYQVPLQQLQRELDQLTVSENAAEAAHRQRLERGAQVAEAQRVQERARQQLLNDSIRQLEQFNIMNAQGNELRQRFRGNEGMSHFNEDWAAMRARLQEAMDGGNFSLEARTQVSTNLMTQYGALRLRLEQEQNAVSIRNEQNISNQRLENLQRLRQEAVATESAFNQSRSQFVRDVPANLQTMTTQVRDAIGLLTGANGMFDPRGQTPTAMAIRRDQGAFTRTLPEVEAAQNAFRRAQGTDEEADAFTRLRAAIEATDSAYRAVFQRAGPNTIGRSDTTGDSLRDTPTNLRQNAEALATHYAAMQAANQQLQQTQATMGGLQGDVGRAANLLGPAAQGVQALGGAAGQQAPAVRSFAEATRFLADQLERLRPAAVGPALPQPGPPPIEGFANGGLIGGKFNSFGPDNRLVSARDGEFIVQPEAASRFYSQLVAINSGRMPSFSSGGQVGSSVTNVGDISINVHDSGDPNATARAVLGVLRRETRRGNGGKL